MVAIPCRFESDQRHQTKKEKATGFVLVAFSLRPSPGMIDDRSGAPDRPLSIKERLAGSLSFIKRTSRTKFSSLSIKVTKFAYFLYRRKNKRPCAGIRLHYIHDNVRKGYTMKDRNTPYRQIVVTFR